MKVFVLNPPFGRDFCRSARWAAKSRGRVQRHPDWLLTAVALLEQSGHQVLFLDGAAQNLAMQEILERVNSFQPDFSVFHTTTPTIYGDIEYAKLVKEATGCTTALVGYHVTVETEDTFKIGGSAVDFIVKGEYDNALCRIAEGRAEDRVVSETVDMKSIPFPAWHHIDPRWYRDFGKRYPFITILSGRGCFGQCTFCTDPQTIEKGKLRFRPPEAVVDEIENDYRLFPYLKEIMFETDTFTASKKHVQGVCEEILKRNLKITFSVNTRVDMDLSLLPLLKRAGLRMLMIGFELGTQEALDAVKKGTTLEQSREFAETASKLGLTLHGCFMFGAPGEIPQSARQTIDFAKSLPLDTVQFSGICVYPGTEMYRWAQANGYLVPQDWRQWVDENREQITLLNYPQFSKEQIDAV
jgi:radical SAM superfamily enzyme YgiQ (UPF0313 family)